MYDVFEKSISQLQKDMSEGIVTSEGLVLAYMERIARLDQDSPKVNLSEFARYMTMEVPNGYSSRGGQTKNPHGDFDPLGNSSEGQPVGISFIAGAFSEPKLLGWGYAFEQASHLRVIPEIARG